MKLEHRNYYYILIAMILGLSLSITGCFPAADAETISPSKRSGQTGFGHPPVTKSLGLTITEGVTLAPEEKGVITSEVTAKLIKWNVKENQMVKAGQPVAILDPIDYRITFAQANSALAALLAQHVSVEKDFNRLQVLLENGSIPQSKFDNVKAQKTALEKQIDASRENVKMIQRKVNKATVRAPFDGVITAKLAPLGKFVMSTMPGGGDIATIEKIDRLKASFAISEMYFNEIKAGEMVDFYIPTLNKTVKAEIESKGKSISALKTFSVIAYIENKKQEIPAGVFATASIETKEQERTVVPSTAVKTIGNRMGLVYTIDKGIVKQKKVAIGFTFEEGLEVIGDIPQTIIKDIANIKNGETVEAIKL